MAIVTIQGNITDSAEGSFSGLLTTTLQIGVPSSGAPSFTPHWNFVEPGGPTGAPAPAITAGVKAFGSDRTVRLHTIEVHSRSTFERSAPGVYYDPKKGQNEFIEIKDVMSNEIGTRDAFVSNVNPGGSAIAKFPFSSSPGAASTQSWDAHPQSRTSTAGAACTDGNHGFVGGGTNGSGAMTDITSFAFARPGTAVSVGDLSTSRAGVAAASSSENGFYFAGTTSTIPASPSPYYYSEKFPFVIQSATATTHGSVTNINVAAGGHSSVTDGFISGGGYSSIPTPFDTYTTIQKFSFSSGGNASNVGNLSEKKEAHQAHQSTTHAFSSGGNGPGSGFPNANSIDKFPFAISSGTASSVGTLTIEQINLASNSGETHAFTSGQGDASAPAPTTSNVIRKFPYAIATGDASAAGTLAAAILHNSTGTSD